MIQFFLFHAPMVPGGILMGMTARRFLSEKSGWQYKVILAFLFFIVIGTPSWIGDENPLFLFPFFLAAFLICFSGPQYARLVIGAVFYTLLIPLNMMIDSTIDYDTPYFFAIMVKTLLWGIIWMLVRRFVSKEIKLIQSAKLWLLLGGLSLAPLFATLSFTIWNAKGFDGDSYYAVALRFSYTVLPFSALSALALLAALIVLSRHEELERQQKLAEIQSVYYQGLQREQSEVRTLRHDLNNHITVAHGLLEHGDVPSAKRYLEGLAHSPALTGSRRICDNDIANAVLASKAAILECENMQADWEISLPKNLSIYDTDLCALLGNAIDNAIEAVRETQDKRIIVRARTDKGVLMLRVENAVCRLLRREHGIFKTTKDDLNSHGFGLAGMRNIVHRYGGSLETTAENGRFELVVYLPIQQL